MNCALADRGRADFIAGKKDEALYLDYEKGADYRRGWQLARLASLTTKGEATAPSGATSPQPPKRPQLAQVRVEGISVAAPSPEPREPPKAPAPATVSGNINRIKAPFPWFGGKSRAADLIWEQFGDVTNYAEPFAGSLAVLLARPTQAGNEIVNDLDCYVANAWRAMKLAPAEVAAHCDWPVNEADLHARHRWLHKRVEFRERMENDPDYFDAKIAAWWIWGLSCWIGDNFCRPNVNTSTPHLTGGQGVARQVPHLAGGKGVARKVPHLTGGKDAMMLSEEFSPSAPPDGRSRSRAPSENLAAWFAAIADRLRFTKVCCGGWERVLTKAATFGQGMTGVLLDPPYEPDGDSHDDVYGEMSRGVSGAVREWAVSNGENPELRIALCGYEGEHAMPKDWECVEWKAAGGYASAAGNTENSARERIWFSPACLGSREPELF